MFRKKSTKGRLLRAAAKLFSANGYEKTTVGDIERAAGLSPRAGGFYRHFTSKESLLVELAVERFESPEKIGMFKAFPLGDTRAELMFIARAYSQLNQDDLDITRVIRVQAARIPALKKKLNEANTALSEAMTDWVATKPALKNKSRQTAAEITLIIFGGWLFYVSRRDEYPNKSAISEEKMLARWADHWAAALDGKKVSL